MGPGEYEQMLHDAEVRLARLKSLYEQYFQGIEKLEPAIPRKELERVLEIMRKSQPRNTALRFRTQMLIAKYGTYVTYWQRIARQIEEGTYRRDVVRAQQRRSREQARRGEEREGPSAWEIDVDVDEVEDLASFSFDESDVDAILGSLGGPSSAPPPSAAPARRLSVFGAALPSRSSAPPEVSPAPAASQPAPQPIAQRDAPAQASAAPPRAVATFGKPASTAVFGKPATATVAKPAAAPAGSDGAAPRAPADRPAAPAASPLGRPLVPPLARPPGAAAVPPPGMPPPGVRPPVPAPQAAKPLRGLAAPAKPPPVGPAARPVPPPARPAAPPARPAAASVDDAEMRRIYDRYVEARRRNNERVDNVRYETLAQSVHQMIPKLREKHGDRKIDFDVVVQNGKVGLKPKVG